MSVDHQTGACGPLCRRGCMEFFPLCAPLTFSGGCVIGQYGPSTIPLTADVHSSHTAHNGNHIWPRRAQHDVQEGQKSRAVSFSAVRGMF